MDQERERRLNDLLFQAFDYPPAQRRAFLDQAAADDPELLAEAAAMLAEEDELGDFLERPAVVELTSGETGGLIETQVARPSPPPKEETEPTKVVEVALGLAEEPVEADLVGQRLGTYEIFSRLGGGGMGDVYVGRDTRLGRRVALKVLPPEMSHRAQWMGRFKREARALAAFTHPNIVTVHSVEEDRGIHFLTMELVEGTTLRERIPEHGFEMEDLLDIAVQLVDAVAAAHEVGVTHRDLKPQNVMITSQSKTATGRVKVLDFGIAKLPDSAGIDITTFEELTHDGQVLGTVAYMAPEQLEGEPVDARADVFGLGVLLFEMATGKHPFERDDEVEHLTAIIHEAAPRMTKMRAGLPAKLADIVERCLAKNPDDRYPSAAELRDDLAELHESVRAEALLESRTDLKFPVRRRRRPWGLAAGAAVLLLLAIGMAAVWEMRRPPPESPPVATEKKPTSLAVLFFQNLGGDPELDWLSNGIAEMLVTDLSQSPELDVLPTAELHEMLEKLGGSETGAPSAEVLRQVSRQADADAIVSGNFVLLGEKLRIAITVEDAGGKVLFSDSVSERGIESLFGLVEKLDDVVRRQFDAPRPELGPSSIEAVTTSSIVAWQAYSQGMRLSWRSHLEEAAEKLDEAIAADPDFGLAYLNLSAIHVNLGHSEEARRYASRAFELSNRLPLYERFSVEGSYYGSSWSTNELAIDTYSLGLRAYPHKRSWRNNLARRYAFFERYPEAIQELEKNIAEGTTHWGTFANAANAYAALGQFEKGYHLLDEAIRKHPEDWLLHYALAWHLTEWGHLEEAAAPLAEAAELHPGHYLLHYSAWRREVLLEDWPAADREAEALTGYDDSFARWRGAVSLGKNALYHGRGGEALRRFDEAIEVSEGADQALARCFKAELLLALDDPAAALAEAERAQAEGAGQFPELLAMFFAALAEERLGESAQADALLEALKERWRRQTNAVEKRQILHLSGLLALRRGDAVAAAETLRQAVDLLPPKGVEFHWHVFPDHVPLWTSLGEAELALDRPEEALTWLGRASSSGSEHLEQPLAYVRSFDLRSSALQAIGDQEGARRNRDRFLAYWNEAALTQE